MVLHLLSKWFQQHEFGRIEEFGHYNNCAAAISSTCAQKFSANHEKSARQKGQVDPNLIAGLRVRDP